MTEMNIAELQKWVGRTETVSDQITPVPMASLAATLDLEMAAPKEGDLLPPLWHWLYFLSIHRQSELGVEGHSTTGGFLPPIPLPRRMWAGSRFEFHSPLRVGCNYTRTSRVVRIQQKQGRTGPLAFVVLLHEIASADGIALSEEQDLVYRGAPKPGDPVPAPVAAPTNPRWQQIVYPDDVLLFRYSALTFNAHRIHYDYRYATQVEGYPGLVVHGPLIATLLCEHLRRNLPDAILTRFAFRAVSPLFDTGPFRVCGRPDDDGQTISLWARTESGALASTATATVR
jgi:3-methylfumaryl-CoA hydratase